MCAMPDRLNEPAIPAAARPAEVPPSRLSRWRDEAWRRTPPSIQARWLRFMDWVERKVPPGLRLPLGILLMIGGLFAFLPFLAVWMFPLGIAVAALDVRPMMERRRARREAADAARQTSGTPSRSRSLE